MDRREFIKTAASAAGAAALLAGSRKSAPAAPRRAVPSRRWKKILVLGFDGLDPRLVGPWMAEGRLPAFRKLAARGGFRPLRTSMPPQSPVAWSNFITGMNPGGHGIFDFMHRDPLTYLPVFSAAAARGSTKTLRLGQWLLPLKSGTVENLIRGRAFWQILDDHGVPSVIWKMPSNYPPVPSKSRTLSGMNTPDLLGSYGICQYYTTESRTVNADIGGARVHQIYVLGNRVDAKLPGPVNTFRVGGPESSLDFRVYLDPLNPVAKIVIQGQEFILKEKEWSGWKRVNFPLIPTRSVGGICMFYLKEIRPAFKLYVSPINIDPADPAQPISTPGSYAAELEKKFGPYFTKGLPADTSALDNGLLDESEFLAQDEMVLEETRAQLDHELGGFDGGVLFHYVSSTDQRQHMFWRLTDPAHPGYDAKAAAVFGGEIERVYRQADEVLAQALARVGDDTLVLAMSDHGFNPYARSFSLNTWLRAEGYHVLRNEFQKENLELGFAGTAWGRTKAYGVGFNALYINERGREAEGVVAPGAEKEALVEEIRGKLEAVKDPKTGERVIHKAYRPKEIYRGPQTDEAPDLVLGFARGYRIASGSSLGRVPRDVLEDNVSKWSGDHMCAAEIIPGVLLTNGPLGTDAPALYDLTATILDVFGIEKPDGLIGRTVLQGDRS